eukprot:1146717-Pelagomonas_calceolata.AAC.9
MRDHGEGHAAYADAGILCLKRQRSLKPTALPSKQSILCCVDCFCLCMPQGSLRKALEGIACESCMLEGIVCMYAGHCVKGLGRSCMPQGIACKCARYCAQALEGIACESCVP